MIDGDGKVRCAVVRIASRGHSSISVKRPVQRLYPLELRSDDESGSMTEDQPSDESPTVPTQAQEFRTSSDAVVENGRPRRQAFHRAKDTIRTWCKDLGST